MQIVVAMPTKYAIGSCAHTQRRRIATLAIGCQREHVHMLQDAFQVSPRDSGIMKPSLGWRHALKNWAFSKRMGRAWFVYVPSRLDTMSRMAQTACAHGLRP